MTLADFANSYYDIGNFNMEIVLCNSAYVTIGKFKIKAIPSEYLPLTVEKWWLIGGSNSPSGKTNIVVMLDTNKF